MKERGLIRVFGEFHNDSHRADNLGPPIRNISGVIAPYEDALCQAIANFTGVETRRQGGTEQSRASRFIENYQRRNYKLGTYGSMTTFTKHFIPKR